MSTLAISAANLETLENNLHALANNVGDVYQSVSNVTGHVNDIETKVTSVTENVKTLEEEIKSFMLEIRESSIVGNARQTILMDQAELDKKYGHYDEIRRRINGILQSTDLNAIKKSTMLNISEQTLINAPNYWLAPALVALCAWILNDKPLAEKALKEAMNRDDEKTSLLFCLINLRAHRTNSSIRWLNRYLNMQNPTKMDGKIITVLDAITSGVFGKEVKEICINKVNEWIQELNIHSGYKDIQKERWIKYLEKNINQIENDNFPYLTHHCTQWESIKKLISISTSHNRTFKDLKNMMEEPNSGSIESTVQIDNLLNILVFNYENEELDLKKDIQKNKHIIEENGNITKALERFEQTSKIYDKHNDFLSHLTNIVLEYKTIKPNLNTRKYAMALSKDLIKQSFIEMNTNTFEQLPDITLKINDWTGTTKNGSNEKELKESLNNYVESIFEKELSKEKLFNTKMFISIILCIIAIFLTINIPVLAILILLVTLIYNIYEFYTAYKNRSSILESIESNKKTANDILTNIIAEVVDYSFLYENNLKTKDKIINYINSLDSNQYIKSNKEERNVMINGGM